MGTIPVIFSLIPDHAFHSHADQWMQHTIIILEVPVGLVVAAWGGSACEAWMTADWLKAFPDAKIPQSEADIKSTIRHASR